MIEGKLQMPISFDGLLSKAVRYVPQERLSRWVNKIHCGDCVEVLSKMPPDSIETIVTSPPYNLRNSSGGGLKNGSGGKWENAELLHGYSETDDCLPYDEYVRWQRDCLKAMMRVLKSDGAIFYNHKWRVQRGLLQDRSEIVDGFPVRINKLFEVAA